MRTVGVRELEDRISEILRLVQETGEIVEVTKGNEVIAHLVPVRRPQQPIEQPSDASWNNSDRAVAEHSVKRSEGGTENRDTSSSSHAVQEVLSLAGAWSDLDWDEMEKELHRIRHENQPTPPISL